jgi:hypothetical protein
MHKIPRNALLALSLSTVFAAGILHCSSDQAAPVTAPAGDADVPDGEVPKIDAVAPVDAAPDAPTKPTGASTGPVDRAGRPLAILLSISAADRDSWNIEDSFGPSSGVYENQIQNNLIAADKWDNKQDWDAQAAPADASAKPPDGGTYLTHPLGELMFRDRLIVDATKPFSETSYLDLENEAYLGGPTHLTCGGRWPGEDAIDKELSLVVKGTLTGVSDGVSAATAAPTKTFPYLAAPN